MKFYLVGARLVAQRLVGVRQLLLHHHDDNVDGDESVDGDAKYLMVMPKI